MIFGKEYSFNNRDFYYFISDDIKIVVQDSNDYLHYTITKQSMIKILDNICKYKEIWREGVRINE